MTSNERGFGLIDLVCEKSKVNLPISVKTIPLLKIPPPRIILSNPGATEQTVSIASDQEELLLSLKEDTADSVVRSLLLCAKQDGSCLRKINLSLLHIYSLG